MKNIILVILYTCFWIAFISFSYTKLWINVDSVKELNSVHIYSGEILDFECIEGRKPGRIFFRVYLKKGEKLKFRAYGTISCDEFKSSLSQSFKGKKFEGYFCGANPFEVSIDRIIYVNFHDMKAKNNSLFIFTTFLPLIITLLLLLNIYKNKKKLTKN